MRAPQIVDSPTSGWPPRRPDDAELRAALAGALGAADARVVERRRNSPSGTFHTEILTCFVGETQLQLFCKYSGGVSHRSHGHRGGVRYEAAVYQRVLEPLKLSTPDLLGVHEDPHTGEAWLFIEHLADHMRLKNTHSPDEMSAAAAWIGRFHALTENVVSDPRLTFLTRYDAEYYVGWATRTRAYADAAGLGSAWLDRLCAGADKFVELLIASPLSVIHGEHYPGNILMRNGVVHPVDWESAAVARGEIDLASLSAGWPSDFARRCRAAYARARWPTGPPAEFETRLNAAALYLELRWLGDRPEWIRSGRRRLAKARALAERLGLL